MSSYCVAVIGGGPAGLMAAETLADAGVRVDVYDAMPSVGRKFLLAGRGGLNLTHSELLAAFVSRYGHQAARVGSWLEQFDADALRQWAHGLGISTFVGSSGRVFPSEMKAAPLLRAWLQRLRANGVRVHARHVWRGWTEDGALKLDTPQGAMTRKADAVVLALGGASWARLGSDGAWQAILVREGVAVSPLLPANCGFTVNWSPYFTQRFSGEPLKSIAMAPQGDMAMRRGECVVTHDGLEGGVIYAWSAHLRDAILATGAAVLHIDLLPDHEPGRVLAEVTRSRGARSWSSHLGGRLGLRGVKAGLLRECLPKEIFDRPDALATAIKQLPLRLCGVRPLDEAISTAGGVRFDGLDPGLMLNGMPGVFCAGEMLDWEAPTGGYLLTACFASGRVAAQGVLRWLDGKDRGQSL
ncbi:aminoacetone oxidase family FAD-binding enzyme [Pollutimonas nitritireducens]|uniref:Aminoacetone oxidase family FAD-binding enzyme n=1 Tax=Pollutimonas nitritireducens TaxID=2045209 RepID=A0A2N4UHD3_9BURK|nr:TIGR03862 family flavoprotein [Pollutimonas nitritireducens]PLC54443.1 aminoacetone oxidase family FAD-binding enzyme [Pollutimonas nitritireducens]